MRVQVLLGSAVLAMAASGFALAQGAAVSVKADDIIAARQSAFDLQAGVAAAMKVAIDSGLDVKGLTAGAKGFVTWGRATPGMFPDGTQTGHDTKAKPEIWSDRAGFEKVAAAFVAESEKLVTLAEANDKAGFAAQYAVVGRACGGCHRPYRAQ